MKYYSSFEDDYKYQGMKYPRIMDSYFYTSFIEMTM